MGDDQRLQTVQGMTKRLQTVQGMTKRLQTTVQGMTQETADNTGDDQRLRIQYRR
ncbi:unnamed protein product [Staurois parvus]|uniref:CsbD family protein n=1 Tax=Staurois parvus TaxID=386267 RepID=A0ABN9HGC4_9NEOB|nr:unnamed protein product [Staurois parvus]